jgi:N-acetylneuraminic acid mutarotase
MNDEMQWEDINTYPQTSRPSSRNCHSAILYNNYMIIFGGKEGDGKRKFVNDLHVLDLDTLNWVPGINFANEPPEPRMGHSADLYKNKYVIIYGGWNGIRVLDDVYLLEIGDHSVHSKREEKAKGI